MHQAFGGHAAKDVQVARDQGVLGDDADWQLPLSQHLQQRARNAQFAFDGLVRVGVGTQHDQGWLVTRLGQLGTQQGGCIALGENLRFKIKTRRQTQVGVRGSGIAIHAAMLATLIGVDALLKADVGRLVAADDAARHALHHHRLGPRQFIAICGIVARPILLLRRQRLTRESVKARTCIGQRATALVEVDGVHGNVSPEQCTLYAANCSASSGLVVPPAATLSTCV